MEFALGAEIFDQRGGLGGVDPQTVADGFLVVVRAVAQVASAFVAAVIQLRRRRVDVVDLPAGGAGTTPGQALHEDIEVHIDKDGGLERHAHRLQHGVEGFGLGNVAGKSVEDEPVVGVRFGEAFADDAEDDLIADQLARIHGFLGPQSEGGACCHRRPQQITRGDLWDLVLLHQQLRLRPFPGPRCAEQYDSHVRCSPKCPIFCSRYPVARSMQLPCDDGRHIAIKLI